MLACRNVDSATAAAERIRAEGPPTSSVAELDLASMASVRAFADAWDGPLDLLVNNAGVMAPPKLATHRATASSCSSARTTSGTSC